MHKSQPVQDALLPSLRERMDRNPGANGCEWKIRSHPICGLTVQQGHTPKAFCYDFNCATSTVSQPFATPHPRSGCPQGSIGSLPAFPVEPWVSRGPLQEGESHITPLLIGDAVTCKRASDLLLERFSVYVQPINYPTVDVYATSPHAAPVGSPENPNPRVWWPSYSSLSLSLIHI